MSHSGKFDPCMQILNSAGTWKRTNLLQFGIIYSGKTVIARVPGQKYRPESWAQSYEIFYIGNLQMFVIS